MKTKQEEWRDLVHEYLVENVLDDNSGPYGFSTCLEFIESNLEKVPKVAELIEVMNSIKASAHIGIGLHKNGGLSLNGIESGLNGIIDDINEALKNFKERR